MVDAPQFPVNPAGASVRVVDLAKDFGTVDHVSFEVRPGEFLALLGPSGSGKTTILMAIAGFEQPSAGDIFIGDGRISTYCGGGVS